MATFFEQLKDGIANALGIQNTPKNIKTIPFGKGVVIPKLKSLPTVTTGKNHNKGQVAIDSKQDKMIAQTQSNLQSLSKQLAVLKEQDKQQKRLLANLQNQLRRNSLSQSQYRQMSRTIAQNKRTIRHYKNMLYKQKNWVKRQMQVWKRNNQSRINNQSISLQRQMMNRQMQLLERIAKQRFSPQRALPRPQPSVQKKRNSYSRGNRYSNELLRLRRELKKSQALLKARKKTRLKIRRISNNGWGRNFKLKRNGFKLKRLRPRRSGFRKIFPSKFRMGTAVVQRGYRYQPRAVRTSVMPTRRRSSNVVRAIAKSAFGFPMFPTRKNLRTAGRIIKRNKRTALRFAFGIPIPSRKTRKRIGRSVRRGWKRFRRWFRRR